MKILYKYLVQVLAIMLFLILTTLTGNSHAATYYVDQNHPSADDSNAGTEAQPWEHAWYGAEQLVAGDTLIVKAGYYYRITGTKREPGIAPVNSGTSENPITIKANPGDNVYVMAGPTLNTENDDFTNPAIGARKEDYIIIDGFKVYGTVSLWDTTGSTLKNCEIWGGFDEEFACCIRVEVTTDCLIQNNLVRDNDATAIASQLNSPLLMEYDSTNLIIENNTFENAYGPGVRLKDKPTDVHVRQNLFNNASIRGANQDGGSNVYIYKNIFIQGQVSLITEINGVHVYNNVFYNPVNISFQYRTTGIKNLIAYNNIFYHENPSTIFFDSNTTDMSEISEMNYNTYYGPAKWTVAYKTAASTLDAWKAYESYGFDADSVYDNPLFVDAANGNFHLQDASPIKGIGKNGKDMGAYPDGYDETFIGSWLGAPAAPSRLKLKKSD